MKKIILLVGVGLLLGFPAGAQSQDQVNKAVLRDGEIVVETPNGVNVIDYDAPVRYQPYKSKKWTIESETSPVREALTVYEGKSQPLYKTTVYISQKGRAEPSLLFTYQSRDRDSEIIFSPDENFIYYIDTTDEGDHIIHGFQLKTSEDFLVGPGMSLDILDCPRHDYFLVVEEDELDAHYVIYNMKGNRINTFNKRESIEDLIPFICY